MVWASRLLVFDAAAESERRNPMQRRGKDEGPATRKSLFYLMLFY